MDQLDLAVPFHSAADTPLPPHVAETLRALAGVLDDRVAARQAETGLRAVAARHLGIETARVVSATAPVGTLTFDLLGLTVARDLRRHPATPVVDTDGGQHPAWRTLPMGERSELVPRDLAACFPAGMVGRCAVVVELYHDEYEPPRVRVHARPQDLDDAREVLDQLLHRARTVDNPYQGAFLVADSTRDEGLVMRLAAPPDGRREDLVLGDEVWAAVDVNVHRAFGRQEQLAAAGLARTRGLLVAGPPGTGKTALARVIASELLRGEQPVTVVLATTDAMVHRSDQLYEELAHLAPVLVVMEDLDLIARDRRHGGGAATQRLLVALDGLLQRDAAIVSIATTNDLGAIDPAAWRSCRFDQVLHVGLPDDRARRAIIERRLAALGAKAVLGPIVDATRGANGADLHELLRLALLTTDGDLTGEHLLATARSGRWRPAERVGQYL